MPENELDFDPVEHITADAIGPPGQRVFFIQARQGEQLITFLVEKFQIQSLTVGAETFLSELLERFPHLERGSVDYDEEKMRILPPVDPMFRVGEMGLSYDEDRDLVTLVIREMRSEGSDKTEGRVVRLWCTRSQLRAMCNWGLGVTLQGRRMCPYCGEPEDPSGHFCPKKNGRNR